MAKSKHRKKSGARPRPAPPQLHTPETDKALSKQLQNALLAALSIEQLKELEREIAASVEKAATTAAKLSTEEAYKRTFATVLRVLRDRHGFGKMRLHHVFDDCLEYIHDIDEGLLTTEEMLRTLEREDGIRLEWHVNI